MLWSKFLDTCSSVCFMLNCVFVVLSCLFIAVLRPPLGIGLIPWPSSVSCFLVFCHFPIWCLGSGVVLDCIDNPAFAFLSS